MRKAERLLREKFSARTPAWISIIVVTEMAWVLARSYEYARPQIASSIRGLLNTSVFRVEDHTLVEEAIKLFLASAADFSDCPPMEEGRLLILSSFPYGKPSRPTKKSCSARNRFVLDFTEAAYIPHSAVGSSLSLDIDA